MKVAGAEPWRQALVAVKTRMDTAKGEWTAPSSTEEKDEDAYNVPVKFEQLSEAEVNHQECDLVYPSEQVGVHRSCSLVIKYSWQVLWYLWSRHCNDFLCQNICCFFFFFSPLFDAEPWIIYTKWGVLNVCGKALVTKKNVTSQIMCCVQLDACTYSKTFALPTITLL